ncbi:type II CAAX prenyl endopeptidase Rce1 family protein [Roseicyclus persicicus]|uniref:CPBP family intramembrane metalloprotease n=1 Tax=Roseicyclus persicicus TaxID=2650661 RepID=A0A7X6GYB3_9RHOB|nr:CPBP family glutamic-type intramembrane protease [Roseibacterium persicicum]NKX44645.1 CPBP family intramembrane metalloprotease [Roseibacterium persicicum]
MSDLPRYSARAGRALLLGLPGVAALPLLVPVPAGVPPLAIALSPLLLLGLAALSGGWAAPKMGLRSRLVLGSTLPGRSLVAATVAGLALGLAVALADHATAPLWQVPGLPTLREERGVGTLALGLLYGGLTEEVLMRWGLLTALALGLSRFLPHRAALWLAAGLAALAFAAAHLPAVQLEAGAMTPLLTARTLIWNALLGLAYGAALLRGGLEAAILAHIGTHLGFALVAL